LFDAVPLDQMMAAERAVREAAARVPDEVSERFETAESLDDADRKAVLVLAREALAPFQLAAKS
jgi:F-type H+-transporting ATPase subunit alpha